jgi:cysteine desulfurase
VTAHAYWDAAAGVPLHPAAREALFAALADGWADPGKLYAAGRRARRLLDAARASVADSLGVRPDEAAFCASGTAAAHAAVLGLLKGRERAGDTTVHSAIEHSSVLYAATVSGRALSVPVDRLGVLDIDEFTSAVARPAVALAALIAASHEAGTSQPVTEAASACSTAEVPLYVDGGAALGHAPVPDGWSVLSGSARKWGGPAGVGILVVRKGTRFVPPWPGAEPTALDQPGGFNLPAVVAAAVALRAVTGEMSTEDARLRSLVDRIRVGVAATVPDVEVVGHPTLRLPHVVTFSCLYVDGEALLHALDRAGFAVSSGSSCTSSTLRPSHVLEAMGVLSHGNIRISLHRDSTEAEVDRFLDVLPGLVAGLRDEAGVTGL